MNKRVKRLLGRALAVVLMGAVLCGCGATTNSSNADGAVEAGEEVRRSAYGDYAEYVGYGGSSAGKEAAV